MHIAEDSKVMIFLTGNISQLVQQTGLLLQTFSKIGSSYLNIMCNLKVAVLFGEMRPETKNTCNLTVLCTFYGIRDYTSG